jgi:hypothetical protein
LSFAFSSSSCRKRRISDGISPAYFLRYASNVASLMPAFRQTSPIVVPPSASFNTNAICASLNFDLFIAHSIA